MALQHYSGSCQCGAVAFEVDLDLDRTATCNCSRCRRVGGILSFASPEGFRLKQGEEKLTEYRFNTGRISHFFCSTCGIEPFGRGLAPTGEFKVAVNVRCLDGVDLKALTPREFDGASL